MEMMSYEVKQNILNKPTYYKEHTKKERLVHIYTKYIVYMSTIREQIEIRKIKELPQNKR